MSTPLSRLCWMIVAITCWQLWHAMSYAQEIRHSLLIAGPNFTGILDEDQKVAWDSNRPGAAMASFWKMDEC